MGLLQGIGQAKPVSDYVNTALNYQHQQTQNQLMQSHIQMQQQQMQAFQDQNKAIPWDQIKARFNDNPNMQAALEKEYAPFLTAMPDGSQVLTKGSQLRMEEFAKSDPSMQLRIGFATAKDSHAKAQNYRDQANKTAEDLQMITGKTIGTLQSNNFQLSPDEMLNVDQKKFADAVKKYQTFKSLENEHDQQGNAVYSDALRSDPEMAKILMAEQVKRETPTFVHAPRGSSTGIMQGGQITPVSMGGQSSDLGTFLGVSESGDNIYQGKYGGGATAVTPSTGVSVPYDQQAHGNYAKPSDVAQKDTLNDFATYYRGEKEKNPNVTEAQISEGWHKLKLAEQMASAKVRGEGFAASRPVQVLDTKQGNTPAIMSLADVSGANALEPGRYIPMGAQKALGQTALIEDIRGAIVNTRTSLKNLKTDFTATQAAQIALVMKQRDPRSATSAFFGSQIGQTLSPDQVDYVTDLSQLVENGMAMRSVLGAGQGSDELRSAIMNTIPSAKTPNRAYANTQLDKFEQQINRLERGIPNVKLRSDTGKTQTNNIANVIETRTLKDGTTWDKLSDGTFRQVK